MSFPSFVKIVEVGPRDGLQNESHVIPSEVKINFINMLSQTGLRAIEVTSFVSPKWVPQMEDNYEVYTQILKKPGVKYSALVPNIKGLHKAISAGIEEIAVFTAASETFAKKNINCTIQESLDRFDKVIALAKNHGIKVRAYISCALGCPYEGKVAPQKVASIAQQLYKMGCYEISLGDTIGVGTPLKAQTLIEKTASLIPLETIAVHFHDTYGQALANIFAVLQQGISIVDSSVAGLGGCPYAQGATGNVATEDVIYLLHGLNIETGIDLTQLSKAGIYISNCLNRITQSKVGFALFTRNFECGEKK